MKEHLLSTRQYINSFVRWWILAFIVGLSCGMAGTLFHICINYATQWRTDNPWLLYLLPFGGLVIIFIYHLLHQSSRLGTDKLFTAIRFHTNVPTSMGPLIFIGTFITHLLGGSAGREGAALQLGGSIANAIGRKIEVSEEDTRTMTMLGMAALFSSLFGTPITAALFVMEVFCLGHFVYSSFVPCILSSITAYTVSISLGAHPERYVIHNVPDVFSTSILQCVAMGLLCALLSMLFCQVMHRSGSLLKKWFKSPYVRAFAGGLAIIALTLLLGTYDYNGAGGHVIERAIEGSARPQDFILKLLFTAITLGCGYRGGEIVPTFFVGATFGCVVGPLIGMDPGFAAAIGLIATFCGNTNCPIASIFLAIELFDGVAIPLFAIACAVSYMMSGYTSLYHYQMIPDRNLKFGNIIMPEESDGFKG